MSIALAALFLAIFSLPLYALQKAGADVQELVNAGHSAQQAKPPRHDEAERRYNEALQEARKRQDKAGESLALRNLGNVSFLSGHPGPAVEYYQQSVAICQDTGDKHGQGDGMYDIALVFARSQPDKAITMGEQARLLYHEAGDAKNEGEAFAFVGNVFARTGKRVKAREYYNRAAELAHTAGNTKGEADALWFIGTLVWTDPDKPAVDKPSLGEARSYFEKALVLYHKANDVPDEAWTADLIGGISFLEGNVDQTQKSYAQALALYRSVNDQAQIAATLTQMSNVAALQEDLLNSLRYDQEALDIYRKTGDKVGEATGLRHIGDLYTRFGQQRTGLQHYLTALPLFEQAGDVDNEVATLNGIGEFYNILGDRKTAITYFRRVIPLLENPSNTIARQHNLGILANIYYLTGNKVKAHGLLLQQLDEFRKAGYTTLIPTSLSLLAMVERDMGQSALALQRYNEELSLINGYGNNLATAGTLDSISEIEQEQGNLAAAEEHLRQSVAILEKVRASLSGLSEAKSTFLNANIGTYREYLALLLRRNKPEEAFALAQKMKARALSDILYDGKVQMAASLTPEEREEEKKLRQKSDALNYQLVKEGVQNEIGSKKRAEAVKLQITDTERDLQALEDRLYARHPDLALKRAAKTARLEDVGKFLPEDSALLEYVALKAGKIDEALLFVVTKSVGKLRLAVHVLPIRQQDLRERVDALRDACSNPNKEYHAASKLLYKLLVSPAEGQITDKKRLIICPDGPLWDTPFAALLAEDSASLGKPALTAPHHPQSAATLAELHRTARQAKYKGHPSVSSEFLAQRFEIDYAYSATGAEAAFAVRTDGKQRQPTKTMLAFANPNFGDEQRFGDNPDVPGERPIPAASRPIAAPSRKATQADRPIAAASRRSGMANRPTAAPSRRADSADRPIVAPSRPIAAPSRDLFLPRGGYLSELPGTQLEARAIQSDFRNAAIFTGDAAQEATAKREAGSYRYLHFATHGFFNDAAPLLSAIVLALPDKTSGEDGFLTAREIFDLNLNADMVVLSACNTARGEKRSGEGIIGLTWALFAAGAPTQVVSQWSVNDASTALLMKNFYANLTQKHLQKGQALRQAALALMQAPDKGTTSNRKWSHPYYWAPFILVGDWR